MSRVAKKPVAIPDGVELSIQGAVISVRGALGNADMKVHPAVRFARQEQGLTFSAERDSDWVLAGTMRALAANLVHGVHLGFEKRLSLNGIGYRAQLKKNVLILQLGYSHTIEYRVPDDVKIELPSQTEIVLRGVSNQRVGQAASDIRRYRPPEPYKGKGIKYDDEFILRKEGKKKA